MYGGWKPYVPVAKRQAAARQALEKAKKAGSACEPVALKSSKIARTFWGKAWCDNLERYQDLAYRLDRGRSYVRSGSVIESNMPWSSRSCRSVSTRLRWR